MAKKPYTEVTERNPFGDENVDEEVMEGLGRDITFVPGYSEKRMQREELIAKGYDPGSLDYRLHWVRAQHPSGMADGSKIAEMKAKGYTFLKWDEAKSLGITIEDSAAAKSETGNIVNGDLVLMVADKAAAATEFRRARQALDAQHDSLVVAPLERAEKRLQDAMGIKHDVLLPEEVEQVATRKRGKK